MIKSGRIALVLGATGGIGGATAHALSQHGWKIRALSRSGTDVANSPGWDWVKGDALNRDSILAAAHGVHTIVHAANLPGYKNWSTQVVPMIENTIAAAKASGARILLPGTIYNYGADAFPVLREDSPQHATTLKGTVRVELERRMQDAVADGVRSLIVRCGDFFGPRPGGSWFSQAMVKPNHPVKSIIYPGTQGTGHTWAYLPDVAEMIAAIRQAVGNAFIPVKNMPWFIFKLASPFNETMRELLATRPLWLTPIQLDNMRLVQILGKEPHTLFVTAVETALRALGCLNESPAT